MSWEADGGAALCGVLAGMFAVAAVTDPDGAVVTMAVRREVRVAADGKGREPVWSLPWWGARDRAALRRAVRRAAGGSTVHLPSRACELDGASVHLDVSVAPLRSGGEVSGLIVTAADVTARVEGERRLRESDERLRLALEAAEIQSWEMDLRTSRILRGSDYTPLTGPGRPFDTADDFMAALAPADRDAARAALDRAAETGARYSQDHRVTLPDGRAAWIRSVGRVVRDETGKPAKFRGVAVDVTERKEQEIEARRANEEIARREAHLRSILSTVPSAMVVADEEGRITMFSRTAEKMFGYAAEEALGRNVRILMPQKARAAHDASMGRYSATGVPRVIGQTVEAKGRRKGGAVFPLEISIGVAETDGGRYFTAFMTDVTGRKETAARLQELNAELTQVSNGSAMGQLATMLAHELNQPLAAATNYVGVARLLADRARPDGPGTHDLGDALDQAAQQLIRAGRIVSNMREFVARGGPERGRHDPVDLVEEALGLGLAADAYGDLEMVRDYPVGLPCVLADRVQAQQVVINLVRNAREAMEGLASPRIEFAIRECPGEGMVRFSVTDVGHGIPQDVAAHLFTPFRTTKRTGMGLGLSISRTIVVAHGGRIWADPHGGGTTFSFTLPAAAPGERPSPSEDAPSAPRRRRAARGAGPEA